MYYKMISLLIIFAFILSVLVVVYMKAETKAETKVETFATTASPPSNIQMHLGSGSLEAATVKGTNINALELDVVSNISTGRLHIDGDQIGTTSKPGSSAGKLSSSGVISFYPDKGLLKDVKIAIKYDRSKVSSKWDTELEWDLQQRPNTGSAWTSLDSGVLIMGSTGTGVSSVISLKDMFYTGDNGVKLIIKSYNDKTTTKSGTMTYTKVFTYA